MSLTEFIEGEPSIRAKGLMIIDFSQIALSSIMATVKPTDALDKHSIKSIVLNVLGTTIKKNKEKYPDIVIAIDSRNYWRRDIAPYYKGNRKKAREKTKWNFDLIFSVMNELEEDLTAYFPYIVMNVARCEADDIAGVLVKNYHNQYENILMISSDGDWAQMQKYKNVKQYSPIQKKFVRPKYGGAKECLKFKCIKGDAKDGISNIKSDADTLVVDGKRQTVFGEKAVLPLLLKEPESFCTEEMLKRYKENEALLDLSNIPDKYENAIKDKFETYERKGRRRIYTYFVKNSLTTLMDKVGDF